MALNDTVIRTLKLAKGKREVLKACRDLYIRVRVGTTGKVTRTWQFRRKGDGVIHITTLGGYPGVTLKEARAKAAALAAKREASVPTVSEAAEQWLSEVVEATHKSHEPCAGISTALVSTSAPCESTT